MRTPEDCREAKTLVDRFERSTPDDPNPGATVSGGDSQPDDSAGDATGEFAAEYE